MTSSASCPPKLDDDELKLDELVTELHALKKLYGLLQKNSAGPVRSDQPDDHLLDEKSSHLLKKLLDDATQHVLHSQAKIISCTPEMPISEAEPSPKPNEREILQECQPKSEAEPIPNPNEGEKLQELHSVLPSEKLTESAIFAPVAEPKMFQKLRPNAEPLRVPRRKLEAPGHRTGSNSNRSIMSRPSDSPNATNSSQPFKSPSQHLKPTDGKLPAIVPAQKRQRVEPTKKLSRLKSRSSKADRTCRELTRRKRKSTPTSSRCDLVEPNRIKTLQPTTSSRSRESKSTALPGDRTKQVFRRDDRTADGDAQATAINHTKLSRLNRSKARSSSESSPLNSGSNNSSCSTPSTPCKPRRIHIRGKESPVQAMVQIMRKNDQMAENRRGAAEVMKPARSNHGSSCYSRLDKLIPTEQGRVKARRAPPPQRQPSPPPPRHNFSLVPRRPAPSTKAKRKPREEDGRFRRLTKKLGIIFHHHHHHHHHLLAREDEDKGQEEVRSIWKHFKAVLHLGNRAGKAGGEKARHHGYLHVMVESLLRHLWGMRWRPRRRREKVASRRVSKKHRLWAWFRRRGGVVVGGRKRLRLHLGPSAARRRMAEGKR